MSIFHKIIIECIHSSFSNNHFSQQYRLHERQLALIDATLLDNGTVEAEQARVYLHKLRKDATEP